MDFFCINYIIIIKRNVKTMINLQNNNEYVVLSVITGETRIDLTNMSSNVLYNEFCDLEPYNTYTKIMFDFDVDLKEKGQYKYEIYEDDILIECGLAINGKAEPIITKYDRPKEKVVYER